MSLRPICCLNPHIILTREGYVCDNCGTNNLDIELLELGAVPPRERKDGYEEGDLFCPVCYARLVKGNDKKFNFKSREERIAARLDRRREVDPDGVRRLEEARRQR